MVWKSSFIIYPDSMEKKAILTIVVPVHNEEKAIAGVVEQILQSKNDIIARTDISGIEVIIVDDASTDDTARVVSGFQGVRLIKHAGRYGYGRALKTGFVNAQGDTIAFLDGDGTYAPTCLAELYHALKKCGADIVVGSRFLKKNPEGFTLIRSVGNKVFALCARILTGSKISDATTGMRLFKASLAPRFYGLPDGLDFTIAMTIKAAYLNLKMAEVSIPYERRIGTSKLSLVKDSLRFTEALLYTSFLYEPFRLILSLGLLALCVGCVFFILPFKMYLLQRIVPDYYIYRFILILVLITGGVNAVLIGYIGNSIVKSKNKPSYLFSVAGILALGVGVALNLEGIYQYLTSGLVRIPWIRTLIGALFVLTGIQLVVVNEFLKRITQFIKRASS